MFKSITNGIQNGLLLNIVESESIYGIEFKKEGKTKEDVLKGVQMLMFYENYILDPRK